MTFFRNSKRFFLIRNFFHAGFGAALEKCAGASTELGEGSARVRPGHRVVRANGMTFSGAQWIGLLVGALFCMGATPSLANCTVTGFTATPLHVQQSITVSRGNNQADSNPCDLSEDGIAIDSVGDVGTLTATTVSEGTYTYTGPVPGTFSRADGLGLLSTLTTNPGVGYAVNIAVYTNPNQGSSLTPQTFTIEIPFSGPTAARSIASKPLTQGQTVASFTPVTGSGGTGSLTYAISPILPTGLNFSTSTGAITGTPSVTSGTTTSTVTVADANSDVGVPA